MINCNSCASSNLSTNVAGSGLFPLLDLLRNVSQMYPSDVLFTCQNLKYYEKGFRCCELYSSNFSIFILPYKSMFHRHYKQPKLIKVNPTIWCNRNMLNLWWFFYSCFTYYNKNIYSHQALYVLVCLEINQ